MNGGSMAVPSCTPATSSARHSNPASWLETQQADTAAGGTLAFSSDRAAPDSISARKVLVSSPLPKASAVHAQPPTYTPQQQASQLSSHHTSASAFGSVVTTAAAAHTDPSSAFATSALQQGPVTHTPPTEPAKHAAKSDVSPAPAPPVAGHAAAVAITGAPSGLPPLTLPPADYGMLLGCEVSEEHSAALPGYTVGKVIGEGGFCQVSCARI
jgi:hypothetical protein